MASPTPSPQAAIVRFEEFLRARDLKLTTQRRAILKRIAATQGHFSADDLVDRFRREGAGIAKATVYRTLALLDEAGLIESLDFNQGYKVYEFTHDREHHDHIYCLDCGVILEFQNERIEKQQERVARDMGFTTEFHSLKLFGHCDAYDPKRKTCPRQRGEV